MEKETSNLSTVLQSVFDIISNALGGSTSDANISRSNAFNYLNNLLLLTLLTLFKGKGFVSTFSASSPSLDAAIVHLRAGFDFIDFWKQKVVSHPSFGYLFSQRLSFESISNETMKEVIEILNTLKKEDVFGLGAFRNYWVFKSQNNLDLLTGHSKNWSFFFPLNSQIIKECQVVDLLQQKEQILVPFAGSNLFFYDLSQLLSAEFKARMIEFNYWISGFETRLRVWQELMIEQCLRHGFFLPLLTHQFFVPWVDYGDEVLDRDGWNTSDNEAFAFIFCLLPLDQVRNVEEIFKAMFACLQNGGIGVFVIPCCPENSFNKYSTKEDVLMIDNYGAISSGCVEIYSVVFAEKEVLVLPPGSSIIGASMITFIKHCPKGNE